jgi:pyrimidine-nucleoside phosphorylase
MLRAVDIIRKKRDGEALSHAEIDIFVAGATTGAWPQYQASALLMAIFLRGMNAEETARLCAAMVNSGVRLDFSDLPGVKVDKHSTGGVGDKTSLILAPLAAACGAVVPMMSGRGLGHTGGTLDKLESIPGFRVGLSLPEFRAALAETGCALIGQTSEVAPADKLLYALRDVTGTVESIPLIASSIMSKKIAEGISALVMDVKYGLGAFMKDRDHARKLAETIVAIGTGNGVRTRALLTVMDEPLGNMIGNSLEVIECIETLKGRGPADLEALSVDLAAHMLELAGAAPSLSVGREKIRAAIRSGAGVEKFRQIIAQQGGDPRVLDDYKRLPAARHRTVYKAERSGFVGQLHAERLGRATMVLGAGRNRVEDAVDPSAGAILFAKCGQAIKAGDPLLELHYQDGTNLHAALELVKHACRIDDQPPHVPPLILEVLD